MYLQVLTPFYKLNPIIHIHIIDNPLKNGRHNRQIAIQVRNRMSHDFCNTLLGIQVWEMNITVYLRMIELLDVQQIN
jgi:hypothetical protein